jgi:hypothetical protein
MGIVEKVAVSLDPETLDHYLGTRITHKAEEPV